MTRRLTRDYVVVFCVRCDEAFEPDDSDSMMCPGCRSIPAAALPTACLDDADAPARADIDEPECAAWDALVAELDEMDIGLPHDLPARIPRGAIRELMLRAWQAGGHARAGTWLDDADPGTYSVILGVLKDAGLTPSQIGDVEDLIVEYVHAERDAAISDAVARSNHLSAARADLAACREHLRNLRLHAGTPVMPRERVRPEMDALDMRLGDVDAAITEAFNP